MAKVSQVFFCNDCPKGEGYILVRLNTDINRKVEIVCPKCGRKHPRYIINGLIKEYLTNGDNRQLHTQQVQEIHIPKSAWSQTNPTNKIVMHARNGIPLRAENDFVKERWFELYGERGNS